MTNGPSLGLSGFSRIFSGVLQKTFISRSRYRGRRGTILSAGGDLVMEAPMVAMLTTASGSWLAATLPGPDGGPLPQLRGAPCSLGRLSYRVHLSMVEGTRNTWILVEFVSAPLRPLPSLAKLPRSQHLANGSEWHGHADIA